MGLSEMNKPNLKGNFHKKLNKEQIRRCAIHEILKSFI